MEHVWAKWVLTGGLLVSLWVAVGSPPVGTDNPSPALRAHGEIKISERFGGQLSAESGLGIFTQSFYTYTGTLEGVTVAVEPLYISVRPWGGEAKVKVAISGTVGGSEPGSFTAIVSGVYNPSLGYPRPFRAIFEIVPGSGTGGLTGICGYGEIVGEEPAPGESTPTVIYDFHIQYEEACGT